MKRSVWLVGFFSIVAIACPVRLAHPAAGCCASHRHRLTDRAAQRDIGPRPRSAMHCRMRRSPYSDAGFHEAEAGLSPSARAGREIWYKATAGNDRFHTYTFQQRVTVLIDWGRILRSDRRDRRFRTWGLINDPGCCTPGAAGLPGQELDETYGFDWCPGDEELLKYVGKEGYRDPACDFRDAAAEAGDPEGHQSGRERQLPSGLRHLDRRARFPQVPQPALRCRGVEAGSMAAWAAGTATTGKLSDDARRADAHRSAGSPTPPSSRRSASAPPAVPATSPSIRQSAGRPRTSRWENLSAWSATSTSAFPRC
jgi:hypothetical protein